MDRGTIFVAQIVKGWDVARGTSMGKAFSDVGVGGTARNVFPLRTLVRTKVPP